MAQQKRMTARVATLAAAGGCLFAARSFVPGPTGRHVYAPAAAAMSAATMIAPAAHADEIRDAAKKLADESYAFSTQVDWNNGLYLNQPGSFQPLAALKAIDKMIVMGAAADPKLLKAAAEAHHKAIAGALGAPGQGAISKQNWQEINEALGRVFASVPESMVMDVYKSVSAITDPGVPAYLKSLVNGPDADKAYAAFLDFKDIVKKNQVTTARVSPTLPENPAQAGISAAAEKLSEASYPFLKEVDWLSDIYVKPLPGTTSQQVLKAIDKAIVMGVAMDGDMLSEATSAHHKAITSIDASGVTSLKDYERVNAGIGKIIASVPTSKVMDVYNAFAQIVKPDVPNKMFSMVNPLDANAAAKAFYEFKDVVKAAQR